MSRPSRGPTQNAAGARRRTKRPPRGGLGQPAVPTLVVAVVLSPPLPVQALWWSSPATRAAPLAIAQVGRLVAVCPQAAAAGCAAGQTPAQARLLCPTLLLCPPSLGEPWLWETALRALATVSPVVEETERQRGVACLDGHGLERLWGAPVAICQRALDTLAAEGLQAWAGAGPTRLIALACAERQGPHGAPMVREGPEAAAFLAALPLDDPALGLSASAVGTLRDVGITTAGALGALPLAALALRFGPDVLAAWRRVRGEHEPLRAWSAPLCRQVTERYEESVADSIILQRLLTRLCGRLANDLAAAGLAAARLVLCLECDGGARQVEQARHWPTLGDPLSLERAALALLARYTPAVAVTALSLYASDLGPLRVAPVGLWEADATAVDTRAARLAGVLATQARRSAAVRVVRLRPDAQAWCGWSWDQQTPESMDQQRQTLEHDGPGW